MEKSIRIKNMYFRNIKSLSTSYEVYLQQKRDTLFITEVQKQRDKGVLLEAGNEGRNGEDDCKERYKIVTEKTWYERTEGNERSVGGLGGFKE